MKMSEDADFRYALELQKRLNHESSDGEELEAVELAPPKPKFQVKRSNPHSNLDEDFLNRTQNLVHPMWETLDPTPDIFALFGAFDSKFFQGRLKCVLLEWSKRMYSCAGICYSSKNRFGMAITIRLSEPLLKLRPRKDLVETMLHEMIHAYCFVLNIREGNGGHGPHFKKIMQAINKVAGTNITVYHMFHDEVNLYKQHWWRCNGICQNRSPFFGYVKRTSNRAPGPNDQWWSTHQESCGGTFMKIKEPDRKKNKSEKVKAVPTSTTDIRTFFNSNSSNKVTSNSNNNTKQISKPSGNNNNSNVTKTAGGSFTGLKGPIKSNGGGTLLLNPKTNSTSTASISKAFPPTSYPGLSTDPFNEKVSKSGSTRSVPGGNLRNVVGFRDLNGGTGTPGNSIRSMNSSSTAITGRGYTMGSTNSPSSDGEVDRNHLRDIWSKRFGGAAAAPKRNAEEKSDKPEQKSDAKRRRKSSDAPQLICDSAEWERFDDDIMIREEAVPIVTLSSDDEDDRDDTEINEDASSSYPASDITKSKPLTSAERQNAIKQEILDDAVDLRDEDIILIDDEYDDAKADEDANIEAATALADASIIDEFFGEDTLLKEFILENDVRPTFSRHVSNPENDIITCPVCQNKLKRIELEDHLNGCMGIAVKLVLPKHALKKLATTSREAKPARKARPNKKDVLRAAGYTEDELAELTINSSTDDELTLSQQNHISLTPSPSKFNPNETVRTERLRNVYKTTRQCPVCAQEIEEDEMNDHLDECLTSR